MKALGTGLCLVFMLAMTVAVTALWGMAIGALISWFSDPYVDAAVLGGMAVLWMLAGRTRHPE
jgi:uncharacterized membrane protein YqjE